MITATIAKLRADCPALKLVDGATALSALGDSPPPIEKRPAAYVLPIEDRGGENKRINGIAQQVVETIAVALCVGGRPSVGELGQDDVEAARDAVRTCLLGWQPEVDGGALEYVSGRVASIGQRVVWLDVRFRRDTTLRA